MSIVNKKKRLHWGIIVILSFLLSMSLGMMDYETTSFVQMLAGDSGANFIALLLYTLIFTGIIWGVAKVVSVNVEE